MEVVFLDIDGTLVDYSMAVPASAVQAIRRARERGHQVYLTTGRSRAEVYPDLWEIGFDGLIGGNGMYIERRGEVLVNRSMARADVVETVAWMQERGLGFYLESKNGLFGNDRLVERAMFIFGEDTPANRAEFAHLMPELIYDGSLDRDDVAKISFALNPDHYAEALETFGERLKVTTWSGTGKGPEFGEFAILGVDKVHAVIDLLSRLDGVERTFAFGDAASDRAMIEFCDVGVAMGNSPDELKAVADHVTAHVAEDGLAKAFEEFGLI
ncbi:MAG: HAD family hydrolase [Micropruina sp.]|nr:HAD family hydrolase [Micropruina sp.]